METPSIATLRVDYPPSALPGQFVMVWVPGDDEIPMSLSYVEEDARKGITVKVMGDTSRKITRMKVGDKLGLRGPYGNHFDLIPKRILLVGGGSGVAVLAPAAEAAKRNGSVVDVAIGATTSDELLFKERLRRVSGDAELHIATDDGSEGHHGYVTGVVGKLLAQHPYSAVWTCGPEIMMAKVFEEAKRHAVPVFGSMERVMKCAINVCDACTLGPYHVCTDGPIFPGALLSDMPDFGHFKHNHAGTRVPL